MPSSTKLSPGSHNRKLRASRSENLTKLPGITTKPVSRIGHSSLMAPVHVLRKPFRSVASSETFLNRYVALIPFVTVNPTHF